MMTAKDQYIEEIIRKGDSGSKFLAAMTAPTLKNCKYLDVISGGMNGLAVIRVPESHVVVVHSAAGDSELNDTADYINSMVDRLMAQASTIGAKPLAFANVVDAGNAEKEYLGKIGEALASFADIYRLSVINGELAVMPDRIKDFNINGTMISIVQKGVYENGVHRLYGVDFAVFDPQGDPVSANSDGTGSKLEFGERTYKSLLWKLIASLADEPWGNYSPGLVDSLEMKIGDSAKNGARVRVVQDTAEIKGNIPIRMLKKKAASLSKELGFIYMLNFENAERRITSYRDDIPAYNISGSAVCTINEERLKNPPKPQAGDYLIAIKGGVRSNGISDKRRIMTDVFGKEWHKIREGELFLDYLITPSKIFYPAFTDLLEKDIATSVFHMSGGAYEGKLAKPLAKHGLYVEINNLFEPDWRESLFISYCASIRDAFAKWPMGNEGFVTTKDYEATASVLKDYGFETRNVGILEEAKPVDGQLRTGVNIHAYNGAEIYFSGR